MAAAQTLHARQGDKLDLLLWRDAGLGPADLTRVLDANPGLSDRDAILPVGTAVFVPATPDVGVTPTLPIIQLWG